MKITNLVKCLAVASIALLVACNPKGSSSDEKGVFLDAKAGQLVFAVVDLVVPAKVDGYVSNVTFNNAPKGFEVFNNLAMVPKPCQNDPVCPSLSLAGPIPDNSNDIGGKGGSRVPVKSDTKFLVARVSLSDFPEAVQRQIQVAFNGPIPGCDPGEKCRGGIQLGVKVEVLQDPSAVALADGVPDPTKPIILPDAKAVLSEK